MGDDFEGEHYSKILTGATGSERERSSDTDSESVVSLAVPSRSSEDEETSGTDTDSQKSQKHSTPSTLLVSGQENPEEKSLPSSVTATTSKPRPASATAGSVPAQSIVLPDSDGEDWESMSEVSDSPDVGDVQLSTNYSVPLTKEDQILQRSIP